MSTQKKDIEFDYQEYLALSGGQGIALFTTAILKAAIMLGIMMEVNPPSWVWILFVFAAPIGAILQYITAVRNAVVVRKLKREVVSELLDKVSREEIYQELFGSKNREGE